jgi:hypothetical protein
MADKTPDVQTQPNPASAKVPVPRKRIPMSVPLRKLEVPEIPGYYLYWFRDENVPRAMQAGYEFVEPSEVNLNPMSGNPGASTEMNGNTDLGNRVSLINGTTEGGRPVQAVLMKLKQEWRDEDQEQIDQRNFAIIRTIFKGEPVARPGQMPAANGNMTYLKQADMNTPVMQRPIRKAKHVGPR